MDPVKFILYIQFPVELMIPFLLIQWVPPNLSVPILNLVDVIFQLQDGGWIRYM